MANKEIGMLLLGIAIGTIIPALPAPINILNPYEWIIFLVVGLVLLVKGGE